MENGEVEIKRPYRVLVSNWQRASESTFQAHHEVRIPGRNLKDPEILTPQLFMNLGDGAIRPGDRVCVVGFEDNSWNRLTQFVYLRVVSTARGRVRFVQEGDVVDVPYDKDEKRSEEPVQKAYVKRGFGGVFNVYTDDDDFLEQHKTKKEADEHAARINAGGQ